MKCKIKNNGKVVTVSSVYSFPISENVLDIQINILPYYADYDYTSASNSHELLHSGIYFMDGEEYTEVRFYPENDYEKALLGNLRGYYTAKHEIHLLAIKLPNNFGEKYSILYE